MESKPSSTKKAQLKKSFSAPVLKPQLNKSSKASDKEENNVGHNDDSSKSTEKGKHSKEAVTTENHSNLTQSKKKSLKEGNKKQPKSLCVVDYEELFRNVINASEIKKLSPEESSLDKICTDKSSNINEKENVKAKCEGDIVNSKINVDDTYVKPPLLNVINDLDSIASDEIDEWDNLSTVAKEVNEATPINKVNCNNDIAVVKKKIKKQNKLKPKELFTKPEKAESNLKHSVDIQDKKTNLAKVTIDSVLSKEPKKRKKIRKPNHSTTPVKNCNTDLENSCLSEEEETGTWVQCTNSLCNKWRYLQDMEDPQLVPDNWECKMNSDIEHNTCSLPEVQYDESEHIFTRYTLGSVVWAKMDGYPWWPALIDNDPDYETYFEIHSEDCMVPTNFHVTFFGNCASRAWIKPACIIPYRKNEPKCKISAGHKKDINFAMKLAETALDMNLKERIEKYGFVQIFRKKSKVLKKSTCESDELPRLNRKKCRIFKDPRGIATSSYASGDSQINSKTASLNDGSSEALSENINQPANENKVQGQKWFTPESKVNKENVAAEPIFKDEDKEIKSETNISNDNSVTNSEQSIWLKQEHHEESEKEVINSNIHRESKLTNKANKKMKHIIKNKGEHFKENTMEENETKEKDTTNNTSKSAMETTINAYETQSIKNHSDSEKENINPIENFEGSPVKSLNINKQKDKKCNSSKKEIKTKSVNSKKVTVKSTSCESITNKDVEVENINIPTDETEQITLKRKHKSITCHKDRINKKLKKTEELVNTDLQATLDSKIKKKKNTFSVPVPKIEQSLIPKNVVSPYKDDSHMVPDIKMSVVCEDTINGDELEIESDMKPVLLKCTDESESSLRNTKEQPNDKRVFSDDDSSDFMLDLETEDENKAVVEAFSEVHGRFGGRCFEHGSDSDPLDLIED